ncbi:hypothetical protein HMPREF0201_00875 [Cedecea davisae DSM 4568]|uniref:Uncharacterized protein n=1 Tax=Cedecea davisae DSM 4568 TaxID=566551 RepID=S3JG42_9ENTR|nr:hypothetical protein HMPREF0201_00875 [Cedecea davisae DSM 4568]
MIIHRLLLTKSLIRIIGGDESTKLNRECAINQHLTGAGLQLPGPMWIMRQRVG